MFDMNSSFKKKYSDIIKAEASRLGFSFTGISKAEPLDDDARRLEHWLSQGMHGEMGYMEKYFDLRRNVSILVPGAKSVISLMLNYFPSEKQEENVPKISRYAFGKDYHFVVKEKLKSLLNFIHENIGEVSGRAFVDSGPVLERAWAQKSGLGWIGKNSNLINKKSGSYFFLSELILDLELESDAPLSKNYCGTCTACIDACPTDAILSNNIVDGSKCISYLTIELRNEIPNEFKNKMSGWAFGCDICQEVCPWNRFSKPTTEKDFIPDQKKLSFNSSEWIEMTDEVFRKYFKQSPLKRTKLEGMKRNVKFISE